VFYSNEVYGSPDSIYPSEVFEKIDIYIVTGTTENLAYSLSPVDDSLWSLREDEYGTSYFTLTITNGDLGI
jgi:hypothetical protein